jgi:hypothetical protein
MVSLTGGVPLRWIVTIIFGVSIAAYLYLVVAQYDRWTSMVSHLLHLAMAGAMILMVWRVGLDVPTIGPLIFFLVSGVWFLRVAGRVWTVPAQRLTNCYYAVTMAAMAWMYAFMNGSLPGLTGHSHDHAQGGSLVMAMSGTDMPAHTLPPAALGPQWITIVNWTVTVGFAAIAVYWPCHYLVTRRTNLVPQGRHLTRTELVYQASTAVGTALMFAVTL